MWSTSHNCTSHTLWTLCGPQTILYITHIVNIMWSTNNIVHHTLCEHYVVHKQYCTSHKLWTSCGPQTILYITHFVNIMWSTNHIVHHTHCEHHEGHTPCCTSHTVDIHTIICSSSWEFCFSRAMLLLTHNEPQLVHTACCTSHTVRNMLSTSHIIPHKQHRGSPWWVTA